MGYIRTSYLILGIDITGTIKKTDINIYDGKYLRYIEGRDYILVDSMYGNDESWFFGKVFKRDDSIKGFDHEGIQDIFNLNEMVITRTNILMLANELFDQNLTMEMVKFYCITNWR